MNKLEKVNFIGHVFMYAAKAQLNQEWTLGMAAVIGLQQGLKYKGSFKQGVIGFAATLGVVMAVNGVSNVINHWDQIKQL
jgi:hypothetical protein